MMKQTTMNMDLPIMNTNCVCHILREVSAKRKITHI